MYRGRERQMAVSPKPNPAPPRLPYKIENHPLTPNRSDLPCLMSFTGYLKTSTKIVPGRPVTTLAILVQTDDKLIANRAFQILWDVMGLSKGPLRDLSFVLRAKKSDIAMETERFLLAALSSLKDLDTITVQGLDYRRRVTL